MSEQTQQQQPPKQPQGPSIPMERVYEIIGRMYINLWNSQDSQEQLLQQMAQLVEQNQRLQEIVNQRQTTPVETQNPDGSVTKHMPLGEGLAELAARGVQVVKNPGPNEQQATG